MTFTVADEIRSRLHGRELPTPEECREIRENAGLSQQEVADAVGVAKATISHWEAGARTPRGVLRIRYAEAIRALREAV
jgi:DNA-binding transcriptional regulator YiaG